MKATDITLARIAASEPEVGLDVLYTPFLRRWRFVALCVLVAWVGALAFILIPKREYKAQLVVAAVPNAKSASLAGGITALLGSATMGGVQSTPYFITRLLMLRGVLREVALSPAGDGAKTTVIERVLEEPRAEIKPEELDAGMREVVSTEVDKQTGLVTFAVQLPDSALARRVAKQILAVASRTFVDVMRSQATDAREAGNAQVDSTLRQLRTMEARLQNFQTSHRVYAQYSPAATERQRIDRDLQAAQSAYNDALSDRQSAIARELSELPAVVVVDPIPPELTKVPRQAVLKLLLASVLGLLAAGLVMAAQGNFRPAQPVRLPLSEPRLVTTPAEVAAAGS
jgi:uncharacterized protein involved in exopolysaccharide biosynthesis